MSVVSPCPYHRLRQPQRVERVLAFEMTKHGSEEGRIQLPECGFDRGKRGAKRGIEEALRLLGGEQTLLGELL